VGLALCMVVPSTGHQHCAALALRAEQQDASRVQAGGEEGLMVPASLLAKAKSVHLRPFAVYEMRKRNTSSLHI